MGIDRDFDSIHDEELSLEEYGCDDVLACIERCKKLSEHFVACDEQGRCTYCGHR